MFEFLRKKLFLTLKLWCWYYLSFDEINIEFGFIWELSAENLQTNPKIRWGLFWGLFKTQNRNIQLFSPVNQRFKMQKAKKWIQQTLLPLSMNAFDIITTLRHSWKNAQTSLCAIFRLSVLFFCRKNCFFLYFATKTDI